MKIKKIIHTRDSEGKVEKVSFDIIESVERMSNVTRESLQSEKQEHLNRINVIDELIEKLSNPDEEVDLTAGN